MKKSIIYKVKTLVVGALSMLSFVLLPFMTSCSDFTELEPKGMNLLSSATELELLLNREYASSSISIDLKAMSVDCIYATGNVLTAISQPNKTRDVMIWTWDDGNMDKMAELTSTDYDYADWYGIIGKVCNPIMLRIDESSGDERFRKQLKAEALTLRAYFHFLVVNKFAKAYNPSTAGNDPGVIYLTEKEDIAVPQPQKTVAEVYDLILTDINAAIDLNALPEIPVSSMRVCKATAYAVKALVLQNMQRWDETEAAAKQSMSANGTITNFYEAKYTGTEKGLILGRSYPTIIRPRSGCEEDLFDYHKQVVLCSFNAEVLKQMEKGHCFHDRMGYQDMLYDYIRTGAFTGLTGWYMTFNTSSYVNFAGLRTSQMYLVVAEAELHKQNVREAMKYVDKVREKRISPENYEPLEGTVTAVNEAIERYRRAAIDENICSIFAFVNYKRWNQISGWEKTYTRTMGDKTYELRPNSPMWIFPFPNNVMSANPNIKQNYK